MKKNMEIFSLYKKNRVLPGNICAEICNNLCHAHWVKWYHIEMFLLVMQKFHNLLQ